jgi:FkbM family methyltransferase
MENIISICLTIDENYAEPCRVVITSILKNANNDDIINFYILHSGLNENHKNKIYLLKRIKDFSVQFIQINIGDFEVPVTKGTHFKKTNYFRLRIPSLIHEIDKVIYLDTDIIVNSSLQNLFNIHLDNFALAAVPSATPNANNHLKRLKIDKKYKYINSGVLVINCEYWRLNNIEDKIFSYIHNNPPAYFLNVDQDAINGLLFDKIKYLNNKWNYEIRTDTDKSVENLNYNQSIFHFVSYDKPWHINTKHNASTVKLYQAYQEVEQKNTSPMNNYNIDLIEQVHTARFNFSLYSMPSYSWKYSEIVFEEMSALLIRQMVKGAKSFIDIGAHCGFYSVLAGLSNPNLNIFAFEPISENFEILQKNLALNDVNARTFQIALSDFSGTSNFQVSEQSSQSGFIANPDEEILKEIEVNVDKLDHYLDSIPTGPVIIKMDTEGHELRVLNGMRNLLEKISDIRLFIEFNPNCLVANEYDPQLFLEWIMDLGFDIFVIGDPEMQFVKFSGDIEYQAIMGERTYRNLYCVRSEHSLNLCIFSHSGQLGGAEKSLLQLVKELTSDYGSLCTVILPDHGPSEELLQEAGAAVIIEPLSWWCSLKKYQDRDIINRRYALSLDCLNDKLTTLKKIDPDIILTNSMVIPWGAMAALLLKKPHVWMVNEFGELDHGFTFYEPFNEITNYIIASSDKIVTNSKSVRKILFPGKSDDKIQTIYRHIELTTQNLPPTITPLKWFKLSDATHLIMLGSIKESKGQEDAVLAAIELVKNRARNVELLLIGEIDLSYKKRLQQLINNQGVQDYVTIFPFVEDIFPILNEADIALVCSRMEAFGRVTLEAMLMQKLVIATNTGGTPELIADGDTGFLFTPGNYRQLADQIEKIIENPGLGDEVAQKGYHFAKKSFTKENFGGKYFEMLKDLKNQDYLSKSDAGKFLMNQFQNLVNEKNQTIQGLNTDLAELQQTIQQLTAELAEREQEVQYYALSKSWRITRPLRKLMRFFRRRTIGS